MGDRDMMVRIWNKDSISSGYLLHEVTLPDIAVIFIEDFDEHGVTAVKPISFQIDIAKVYLKF